MLTHRQKQVYDYIKFYHAERGIVPTYQEIADNVGCSTRAHARSFVVKLEDRGFVERFPGRARCYRILK